MKTDTILRIIGAVLAVALLGAAAWWWQLEDGREQAAGMITAALGLIALVTRSPLQRSKKGSTGGGGPGAAILALAIVLPAAPSLAACGPTTYRDAAVAGGVLGRFLDVGKETLEDTRRRDLDRIAQGVHGRTTAEIDAAIDAGERAWAPAVSGFNLTRQSWLGYLDGLETAHALDLGGADLAALVAPMLSRTLQLVDGTLETWRRACLATASDPEERQRCTDQIPELPGWVVLAARGLEALAEGVAPPTSLLEAAGGAQ